VPDEPDDEALPTGWRARAAATARVAGAVAKAGARRLVRSRPEDDRDLGRALVAQLDGMKGMAMKVGQILSTLEGVLPDETHAALRSLQRGLRTMPRAEVERLLDAALGAPTDRIFERFDALPVAAASIGQVHRARFQGVEVAVKVRYPHVRASFEADLGRLRQLARVASLGTSVDGLAIVEDLRARLLEECDYVREAAWQRAFRATFADDPAVLVPDVVDELVRDDVLVTTWVDGLDLYAFAEQGAAVDRTAVGATLARFAWRSLFRHAALQADPHPGNHLVAVDLADVDPRVACLDYGCIRCFQPAFLEPQRRLVRAAIEGDRAALREAAIASGAVTRPERLDWDDYAAMLTWQWRPYASPSFRFDRPYLLEGARFSHPTNPNLTKLAMPPEAIWIHRLQAGLHAVLARLGAEGDFRATLRPFLDGPTTPLRA
jgi:predicted unusual protein kinase regulating ubiquinone biosynthesis (AarF/ABC1/UbiB family)